MRLHDTIQDYFAYIEHEQNVTRTTRETYKSWLRHFYRWLEANGYANPTLDVFNVTVLRRFLYELSGRGYRPRTIRGVFHPLRGLGEFLIGNKVLTENPAKQIRMPKMDAADRLTVTNTQVAALLDACERQRTPRLCALSRAIICTFIYSGVRRSELCDLKVGDVDTTEGSILVRQGKGMKSRKVYICADGVDALRVWLSLREKDCQTDFLFMGDRRRRIHEKGLHALLETLKATAGMKGNDAIRPHSLRHWAASNFLRNGANLRDVQAMLGHTNLTITSRYLHSDEERLRDIRELTAMRPQALPKDEDKAIRLPQRQQPERSQRLRRVSTR